MQLPQWFFQQLQASTDGFLRAVEQIPQERRALPPRPNRWSVARIIYHMKCYDQFILDYCAYRGMIQGDIVITCGSTQAIEACATALLDRFDVVAVEAPTYMETVQMLNAERINPFAWALTASYLEHIDYHRRLTWLRAHYCARCQCMLQHLAQIMPASVQWGQPDGGYFLWLTLNEAIDTRQLLRHALGEGVSFVPGSYFYADSEQGQSQLRLSFSWLAEGEMQRGIERLKQAILLQRENRKKGDLYDI